MEMRFFFHWHHHFSAPPACNTHIHTHTHTHTHHTQFSTSQKNSLRTKILVQTDHGVEADERRQRRFTMKIHLANWKLLAKCGGNWFSDVSKLETEGGRTGWKIWRVKGTHKTGKSCPVFGGLSVHISYIHVYPTLGNTPTSCAVMKCEESFITWFSEILEGKDFRDITHLPYCAQNPCHRI